MITIRIAGTASICLALALLAPQFATANNTPIKGSAWNCGSELIDCSIALTASSDRATIAEVSGPLVAGRASVIDGDTLEIRAQRIRLHGIDAPESTQTCTIDGEVYRCGQAAALALDELIAGVTVACRQTDIDRYGRIVAICYTDRFEINAKLVELGWALAYRTYALDYVNEEQAASAGGAGMWAGTFAEPWEYRRAIHKEQAASYGPGDAACNVKGNISSSGEHIYHLPGDQNYEKTRINEANGERWFCTEEEALQAGWRKSRR